MRDPMPEADLVLTTPRKALVPVLLGSLAFCAGSVLMILDGIWFGSVGLVFFGLCTLVVIGRWLRPSTLVVSSTDMASRALFRNKRWDLADCSDFRVWSYGRGAHLVCFEHPGDRATGRGRMDARLTGRSSSLPECYGWAPADLAAELQRRSDVARQRRGSSAPARPASPPHPLQGPRSTPI